MQSSKDLPYSKEELLDKMERFRTLSLFYEYCQTDNLEPIFTLKENDREYKGKKMLSLKRLYLEMEDPTEYEFATTYFYSYPQWERICDNMMLLPHIEAWRKELNLKIKARSIKKNMELSKKGNYNATKWLADRGWEEGTRGRPSEKERNQQLKEDKELIRQLEEDSLRLVKVN